MPPRRFHQKSHHGCSACKHRKIKCDETRPHCGFCVKKKLTCSLLDSYNPILPPTNALSSPRFPRGQLATNDYALPVLELELLNLWHTFTALKLSESCEVRRVMREVVPREGFTHNFLMHGLLAIAALHRVQLDGNISDIILQEAAILHKQKALSMYTPLLSNITEENCNALFAFACLLSILSFASQISEFTRTVKDIADIVDILRLVRGVAVIVEQSRDWIERSEMSILLRSGRFTAFPITSSNLPSEAEVQLRHLLDECQEECKDSNLAAIYLSTIRLLIGSYLAYSTTFDNTRILSWPVEVDTRFFNLLLQSDQTALVIFAHYGAVIALLEGTWWLRGWGRLVI
ncbi:hypothetical protein BGZ60DRAFT_419937, partial [Tricladium varicosporioides]